MEQVEIREPTYDITFYILFNDKERTISFLNAIYDFQGNHKIKDVNISNPKNVDFGEFKEGDVFGIGKTLIFDIKCYDVAGRYFIIEMQKAFTPSFFERVILYGARQLVNSANALFQSRKIQYEKDQKEYGKKYAISQRAKNAPFYSSVPPVRVLSILDYKAFKDHQDCFSSYQILRTKKGDNQDNIIGSNILSWDFVELPKFEIQKENLNTLQNRWLYLLTRRDYETVELTPEVTGDDTILIEAYRRLSRLSMQEREGLEEFQKNCLDSEAILDASFNAGKRKGRESAFIEQKYKKYIKRIYNSYRCKNSDFEEIVKKAKNKTGINDDTIDTITKYSTNNPDEEKLSKIFVEQLVNKKIKIEKGY